MPGPLGDLGLRHAGAHPSPRRLTASRKMPLPTPQVGNASLARLAGANRGILPDGSVHPTVTGAIRGMAGGGTSLGSQTAGWATRAFGDTVADARLHTGGMAQTLAMAVTARAFTVGRDVFFAAGQYQPHTLAGRRLLAHELAHVVQQHGATMPPKLRATQPGDAYEHAADATAKAALG